MSNKIEVIGVQFKPVGKIYYFDPKGKKLKKDQGVLIETVRGLEFGTIAYENRLVDIENIVLPLKPLVKIASNKDIEKVTQNKIDAQKALLVCREKALTHNLEMNLVDCEYTFDKSKILFYFTAEGRIDFRNLVKELASIFRTRIELRQIGVRDEAKSLNGIGMCGRPLCCATFLGDFSPVSIKMAKDQGLSLNPVKISGVCGRLMCCLKYEDDVYQELNKKLPHNGDIVKTADGNGQILAVNTLRQILKVGLTDRDGSIENVKFYDLSEVEIIKRKHQKKEKINMNKDLKGIED